MKTKTLNTRSAFILNMALLTAGAAYVPDAAFATVGGSAKNANVAVPGAAWVVLNRLTFQNPTQRYCTATGSADAYNPVSLAHPWSVAGWRYAFTVSNSPNPPWDQGQERTLEFWNQLVGANVIKDNYYKEITTTGGWMANTMANPGYFTFPAVPAPFSGQTVYFLARTIAGAPPLTVTDSSLTVTCTNDSLVSPLPLVGTP